MKIHFQKESKDGFYAELKHDVSILVENLNDKKDYSSFLKVVLFSLMYIIAYLLQLDMADVKGVFTLYLFLGFLTTLMVLNITHEAAHGTLFENEKLNRILNLWMDVFGTDSYIWNRKHILTHHAYANISGHDAELEKNKLLRVDPAAPFYAHQKYQKFYAPFIYLFYTLNWFFYRDFKDALMNKDFLKISKFRVLKLIIQKVACIIYMIALPYCLGDLGLSVYLIGFLLMHFAISISAVLIIGSSHVNDDSNFPHPNENGFMNDSWAVHQINVTQDFATENWLACLFLGGFNFHVAHHLFPNLPNRYYPEVTKLIKEKAIKFNLNYRCKPLFPALWSHYKLLVKNSTIPLDL